MGHISVFALFAICFFGRFGHFLRSLAHFLGFSGNLGVLRAIVSYKVTRGIILVVGRVSKGYWGGLRASRGRHRGFGGAYGGLGGPLYP